MSPRALRRYVTQLVDGPGRALKTAVAQQRQRRSPVHIHEQLEQCEKIMADEERRALLAEARRLTTKRAGDSKTDD
jgi:hypothetical protein